MASYLFQPILELIFKITLFHEPIYTSGRESSLKLVFKRKKEVELRVR